MPFGNYKKPAISDEHLTSVSQAIQNVSFIHSDFKESLQNVQQGDFVYLDPPYVPINNKSFVGYLSGGFNDEEHLLLRSI